MKIAQHCKHADCYVIHRSNKPCPLCEALETVAGFRLVDDLEEAESFPFGRCKVCYTRLYTKGGCANTGMCGACCAGAADMAEEY